MKYGRVAQPRLDLTATVRHPVDRFTNHDFLEELRRVGLAPSGIDITDPGQVLGSRHMG